MPGVKDVDVDLAGDLFTILYDEENVTVVDLVTSIAGLGYKPTVVSSAIKTPKEKSSDVLPDSIQSLLRDGGSVIVYFHAKWCGACKVMERTTFSDAAILSRLEATNFLRVDVDREPETAETLIVQAVPTIVIISGAGEEQYRRVGLLNSIEMNLVLDEYGK